jgi:3-hydroxyacyl-CoA dehydrogenase/enoyl-CoA hydratase/3-hydroxybutyryl-CoA epimerase
MLAPTRCSPPTPHPAHHRPGGRLSARPANFIGLHFFSPVEKMPLVEIIRGQATSDDCLARAMDFVKALRKTPIVVNDSRGFYTSRVFGTSARA